MRALPLLVVFSLGMATATVAFPLAGADPRVPGPGKPPIQQSVPANPAIDMGGYLKVAAKAADHRESHRISEDEFLRMSTEKGTIILDARSKELYDVLHIKGAINLSFPDISVPTLAKVLPDKSARILIYCNNNFKVEQGQAANAANPKKRAVAKVAERAFPTKMPTASLNISTYIALYNYGYTNVYELAPLIDPTASKLEFEAIARAN
jgi:rhodanese-related sulfurtransferase